MEALVATSFSCCVKSVSFERNGRRETIRHNKSSCRTTLKENTETVGFSAVAFLL